MNKEFLTKVKIELLKQSMTIMDLYRTLNPDIAYNTFYQVLSGQRSNPDIIAKVKQRLNIK